MKNGRLRAIPGGNDLVQIDLALLADAATVDGSGKLNILGVFDRITTGQFPAQHGRTSLVLRFSAGLEEAGEHRITIKLRAPSGDEMLRLDGQMKLGPGTPQDGGRMKVPHILNIDGIVFPQAGTYSFDVDVDGIHQVSLPLSVLSMGFPGAAEA